METVVFAVEREMGALGRDITIAPPSGESEATNKLVYILQRWSPKWEAFVDVSSVGEICDGDRLSVTPKPAEKRSGASELLDTEVGILVLGYMAYRLLFTAVLFFSQETTKQAGLVCQKMNKPSAAHAKVLRGMFPSSSGSKKRTSTAFDPTDDCVFLDQKRKKKAARSKMTKISIFVLEDHSRGVPRGAARKRMIDNHRVVKVDIQRNMSPKQVKSLILREIEHLDIDTYTILECVGSRLIEAVNQMPNGDDLIEDAVKRKGAVVYICDVPPPEEVFHVDECMCYISL